MRPLGIHIRLNSTLDDAIAHIRALGIPIMQSFLVQQATGLHMRPSLQESKRFARFVRDELLYAYAHASYVINPASPIALADHRVFKREMQLVQRLGFTHMVLHPGAGARGSLHTQGIDAVARFINEATQKYPSIMFILENVAFDQPSVGGALQDFRAVLEKIEVPEKLAFCIDTAHAHAYGYDIITQAGREEFVRLIDSILGISRVALLHANDTQERCGAQVDRHAIPGQGVIGLPALQALAMHPALVPIPLILELPAMTIEQERLVVRDIRAWHH